MSDPAERPGGMESDVQEWLEALGNIHTVYGDAGVNSLLASLRSWTCDRGIALDQDQLNTPYLNTLAPQLEPAYPGDLALEKRIENILRWNAMAMVLRAQDAGGAVGGHIATYASAATSMEVGFNHFFRKRGADYGGDLVILQPHASPGVYARAFLEGRLTRQQLDNFRRELQHDGGLPSYPHPRLMPDFWQVPNASMGLSTPLAIYQARFSRYLENRGLKARAGGKVWCFIGDGEADEPEVIGTINMAARERLDNLILVVNCNLQRLDGPVRGNGKIIQELESSFHGAGWNVIKVIWGSGWDTLLAQDQKGILRRRMEECLDGDYQRYSILPGDRQREHWVDGNPELERMMNSLTDEELRQIKRGGQDPVKIFAAYQKALDQANGKPTVILVKTVKGDGMGQGSEGSNTVHQKKNLDAAQRIQCARNFGIPLPEDAVARAEFYCPAEDSAELSYLRTHRDRLGGFIPERTVECESLQAPPLDFFASTLRGSGDKSQSTTLALIRMLAALLRHPALGKYIVPIVPDEARTFGLDALFKVAGIFSLGGQQYTPVDADTLMAYREAEDGQILQEGICETGALASFLAAGTAYSIHGVPTIPFYIFYSIFGFQRVGDMIWSGGDMMCRGFLVGGTAGRTTLNGEGLQHQDGHSHILASTYPNLISYDPAFGYEIAVIIRDGIRRMYQEQEKVFYYLTAYNENYVMPAMPEDENLEQGIIKGAYCYRGPRARAKHKLSVHLLASGAIMQQALQAADTLAEKGCRVHLWSVTSFIELARDAQSCDRWNRLHPLSSPREPYLQSLFAGHDGVFVAVTDYMKTLPIGIAPWMPANYTVLGTDGFGLSETRAALRDYFEISADYVVHATLVALYRDQRLKKDELVGLTAGLNIDPDKVDPATK
ncbi:MAG: pyruvate dehydrogenase (acetyl-transferring), homodimeric type [Pseudohongiellaceae bacterium]